jgi:succinate-acetate transporter protein
MFFGTLKAARMLQFVFLSLTVLFALLAIGHLVITKAL